MTYRSLPVFNLNRNTKDLQAYNKFGLFLVDLCCEHDIHMLNGRLFDDTEGNITCIANNGRSLVDYIIASSNLFDKFSYFGVDNHDFSDHFPLTCSLQLNNISHETDTYDDTDTASKWDKYKWKESLKQEFSDKFRFHYTHFMNRFLNINQNNIAQSLREFVNIFQEAGKSMKTSFPNKKSSFTHAQPEWWDLSCADRKSRKNHALRKFRKSNSNTDFRDYKIERNHLKSLCKIKKKQHQKKQRKLFTDSSNKPKDFCTVIKSGKSKNSPENNICNSDWVNYFQSLFSSEVNQPNIDQNHPLQNIVQNNDTTSLESQITDAEIRYALSKLKADRSGVLMDYVLRCLKRLWTILCQFYLYFLITSSIVGFFQRTGAKASSLQYIKAD